MDRKLQLLGDQILRTLDQIPGNDSRSAAVREHVQALLDALEGPVVSDYASAEYNTPQDRTQAETVAPPGRRVRVPITTAKLLSGHNDQVCLRSVVWRGSEQECHSNR